MRWRYARRAAAVRQATHAAAGTPPPAVSRRARPARDRARRSGAAPAPAPDCRPCVHLPCAIRSYRSHRFTERNGQSALSRPLTSVGVRSIHKASLGDQDGYAPAHKEARDSASVRSLAVSCLSALRMRPTELFRSRPPLPPPHDFASAAATPPSKAPHITDGSSDQRYRVGHGDLPQDHLGGRPHGGAPHVWRDRLPSKYHDIGPRIVRAPLRK